MKSAIVKKYLKDFSTMSTNSLAKKIYAENKDYFIDAENCRNVVRYYRQQHGKKNKKALTDKSFVPKKGQINSDNPFHLPKAYGKKKETLSLPSDCRNILMISDLHIPYHDITALTLAMKYGKDKDIDTIFINGDLLDFFQISRFINLERKCSVKEEFEIANKFLDILNKHFPNVPIYFLKGNHDLRLETYLAVKAPELLGMPQFELDFLLNAKQHNMMVIPDTTLVKMGKLAVTHGHILSKGFIAPVNAARGLFLKAKASSIMGHVHKVSTHSETNINSKVITTYSTGCMCELNPTYSPFANNFSHGFAHIQVFNGGNFAVKNMQIIDGVIVN